MWKTRLWESLLYAAPLLAEVGALNIVDLDCVPNQQPVGTVIAETTEERYKGERASLSKKKTGSFQQSTRRRSNSETARSVTAGERELCYCQGHKPYVKIEGCGDGSRGAGMPLLIADMTQRPKAGGVGFAPERIAE